MLIQIPLADIPTCVSTAGRRLMAPMRELGWAVRAQYRPDMAIDHCAAFTRQGVGTPEALRIFRDEILAAHKARQDAIARTQTLAGRTAARREQVEARAADLRRMSLEMTVRVLTASQRRHLADGPCLRTDCSACARLHQLRILRPSRTHGLGITPRGAACRDHILETR